MGSPPGIDSPGIDGHVRLHDTCRTDNPALPHAKGRKAPPQRPDREAVEDALPEVPKRPRSNAIKVRLFALTGLHADQTPQRV
ncbi:MAG: hypothetical protein Kow0073_03730 [Immundisolibacter sp.]